MSRLISSAEMAERRTAAFDALEARLEREHRAADLAAFRGARGAVDALDAGTDPAVRRTALQAVVRLYVELGGTSA